MRFDGPTGHKHSTAQIAYRADIDAIAVLSVIAFHAAVILIVKHCSRVTKSIEDKSGLKIWRTSLALTFGATIKLDS